MNIFRKSSLLILFAMLLVACGGPAPSVAPTVQATSTIAPFIVGTELTTAVAGEVSGFGTQTAVAVMSQTVTATATPVFVSETPVSTATTAAVIMEIVPEPISVNADFDEIITALQTVEDCSAVSGLATRDDLVDGALFVYNNGVTVSINVEANNMGYVFNGTENYLGLELFNNHFKLPGGKVVCVDQTGVYTN